MHWRTWYRISSVFGAVAFLIWAFLLPVWHKETPPGIPFDILVTPLLLAFATGMIGGILRLWAGED